MRFDHPEGNGKSQSVVGAHDQRDKAALRQRDAAASRGTLYNSVGLATSASGKISVSGARHRSSVRAAGSMLSSTALLCAAG